MTRPTAVPQTSRRRQAGRRAGRAPDPVLHSSELRPRLSAMDSISDRADPRTVMTVACPRCRTASRDWPRSRRCTVCDNHGYLRVIDLDQAVAD